MNNEVFFIDFKEDLEYVELDNIKAKLIAIQPCAQALLSQKNQKYTNTLPFFGIEGHIAVANKSAEIIDKLVDTTGAGDLFAAGFLAEYIRSQDLESSGKEGVKMASIIIQQFGARV